jgi:hypothetical protein
VDSESGAEFPLNSASLAIWLKGLGTKGGDHESQFFLDTFKFGFIGTSNDQIGAISLGTIKGIATHIDIGMLILNR